MKFSKKMESIRTMLVNSLIQTLVKSEVIMNEQGINKNISFIVLVSDGNHHQYSEKIFVGTNIPDTETVCDILSSVRDDTCKIKSPHHYKANLH